MISQIYEMDAVTSWCLGVIVTFFLLMLLIKRVLFFRQFLQELRYLNNEIARTKHNERKYWIKQRRRLWLSLLPFVKY